MSAGSETPKRFSVAWLHQAQQQLLDIKQLALLANNSLRLHVAQQLKTIVRALEYVPIEWGEAIEDLSSLQLTTCIGFHERIAVNYGVHLETHTVFVRSIRLLPGHVLFNE